MDQPSKEMAAPWGVGIDILLIDRIRRLQNPNDPFFRKAFTITERKAAAQASDPALFYATRFAAKEAVFKALRVDLSKFNLDQIEVFYDEMERPAVRLLGALAQLARQRGVGKVDVSISFEKEYTVAVAMALPDSAGNTTKRK